MIQCRVILTMVLLFSFSVLNVLYGMEKSAAVYPFTAGAGISAQEVSLIYTVFTGDLSEAIHLEKGLSLVDRVNLERILREQSFQQSGCTDLGCAVEIGKLANVHYMITGAVHKLGSTYYMTISATDVETGRIIMQKSPQFTKIEEAPTLFSGVIPEFISRVTLSKKNVKRASILIVKSEPSEAVVKIDQKDSGYTPYMEVMTPGTYRIEVSKSGYRTSEKKVFIEEGRETETSFELIKKVKITRQNPRKRLGVLGLFSGYIGGGALMITSVPLSRNAKEYYYGMYMTAMNADDASERYALYEKKLRISRAILYGGIGLTVGGILSTIVAVASEDTLTEWVRVAPVLYPQTTGILLTACF